MRARITFLVGLSALGLLLIPGAASAGSTSTGPLTLTVQDAPYFVKGTQLGLFDVCGGADYESASLRQAVSASSSNGIASWDVAQSYSNSEPDSWVHYARSSAPVIKYGRGNYDNDCGGGEPRGVGVIVKVTDTKGNVAMLEELAAFSFSRWDNNSAGYVVPGTFTFSTGWAAAACAQCDNGSTMNTSKKGASATFTLSSTWAADWGATAGHLGLVMTKGPGHGKVKLYFDGALKATVDTKAATSKYRTFVYDFGPFGPGAHTVKLVNVGTAGRPRIDVQGIGLMAGYTRVPLCTPDAC